MPGGVRREGIGWDPEEGGSGRQASARFPKSGSSAQTRSFGWLPSSYEGELKGRKRDRPASKPKNICHVALYGKRSPPPAPAEKNETKHEG